MEDKVRVPINECQLNTREYYLLKDMTVPGTYNTAVSYLDELQNFTAKDLLNVSGVGIRTVRNIRKVMAHHGLCLRGDFLAHSEEEKKLILDMPDTLHQIKRDINAIANKLNWLMERLDTMHSNMLPLVE